MADTRIHPAAALRPHHRRPQKYQTAGLGRTITWTSYNMPASITQGARTVSFQHDDNHQRIKQISTDGTTLYIKAFGVTAELFGVGTGAARWNDYLSMGNVQVGMRVTEIATQTVSTRYFHTDHLGSVTVITNEAGAVVERLSFDAWGKRRYPNGTDDPTGVISSQTNRGFTGHEELDSVALVHMNGRVYDALVGRMISADPTVPDPMNAQAWNRYSYVGNDPLAFTDPSGFNWFSSFFRSVANFLTNNPIVRAIVQIAITVILTAVLAPLAAAGYAALAGSLAAAGGAAITTGLSGGNLGQALRAGAIAGATAFAFNAVGDITGHTPSFGTPAHAANVAGHALVGCGSSVASGGSCQSGALAGAAGAAAGPLMGGLNYTQGLVASAVVGGVGSVAGGGSFANGAVTGAFGYMFNSQFNSRRAVPFSDDQGRPVLDYLGQPMQRPSDVEPQFFVDQGAAGGLAGLKNFGQGASWDVQRVGSDPRPTPAFIDYATVGIGVYGGAAGIPESVMLSIESTYAGFRSNFGGVQMDTTYTNLPARNVFNTRLGYQLFQSGRIGGTPTP